MARHIAQPLQKGVNGFFRTVDDEQSILDNIIALLFTEPGERFMRTSIGTPIRSQLWDPTDDITMSAIRTFIRQQMSIHEERAELLTVQTELTPATDGQSTRISVAMSIRVLKSNRVRLVTTGVLIRKREV